MNRPDVLTETARAVGFLSRLPVPDRFFRGDDGRLSRAVRTFPAAGLVIALAPALLLALLAAAGAPALVSGLIVTAALVAVTGALHEDGLADTADALGAKGDRDHRLDVMRDSRTGTFGVLALILAVALRSAAIAALVSGAHPVAAAMALLATAAGSRAAMVWHWQALAPARPDGVAAAVGRPQAAPARHGLIAGAALVLVLLAVPFGPLPALAVLAAMAAVTGLFTRLIGARIGGNTGDTLGASQQLADTAGLLALALFA